MRKILLIGNLGYHTNALNGQSIRSQTVLQSLQKYAAGYNIVYIDTSNRKFINIAKIIFQMITSYRIIMLTGTNALRPLLSVIYYLKLNNKTVFVVIGGWLAEYASDNIEIIKMLKSLRCLLVQTEKLKAKLHVLGIENVRLFPNYRIIDVSVVENISSRVMKKGAEIKKIVYCSRVCEEKGVDMAIEAVNRINSSYSKEVVLEIYGPIQDDFKDKIKLLLLGKENIRYMGTINKENIIQTLSEYDIMLFPTHYEGEGFPGVILESMMAGVPIIASNWKYNGDIVKDGFTGCIYDTFSIEDLVRKIKYLLDNPELVLEMSNNCVSEASKYKEDKVVPILFNSLGLEFRENR